MSGSTYRLDYHDPTAGIGGSPPARSALGLRLALAIFGVLALITATVVFAKDGVPTPLVVFTSFGIPATVYNVITVARRLRAERM